MKFAVVTTWNHRLFKEYGHRFLDSYNWPFDLFVYSEDAHGVRFPNVKRTYSIFKETPQCKEFIDRNKDRPKPQDNFLFDACRFSYKVFAYTDFILTKGSDYDGVIYMDADSVFYKENSEEWMKRYVHRVDAVSSFLGRGSQYTETGFLYFNLKHKAVKAFAQGIQDMYINDEVFDLVEWHDCRVYDAVREKMWNVHQAKSENIGDGQHGHVQARSCLAELYDHTKGKRKVSGKSPEWDGNWRQRNFYEKI